MPFIECVNGLHPKFMRTYLNVAFPDTDKVIVGYSGGKDSIAVVDLAVRAGLHVEAFFMYFIPGLDYTNFWVEFAEKTWGIRVRQYLHWDTVRQLRAGTFRLTQSAVRPVSIRNIEDRVRQDSGIDWIGYGLRSQDSLQRRGMMHSWPSGICDNVEGRGRIFCPLKDWSSTAVKAYLSKQGLPIPRIGFTEAVGYGIDLMPETMAYLRERWPTDYRRILKVFPLAVGQADRFAGIASWRAEQKAASRERAAQKRLAKKTVRQISTHGNHQAPEI